jgi:Tfp pilus assembly protein FimT
MSHDSDGPLARTLCELLIILVCLALLGAAG